MTRLQKKCVIGASAMHGLLIAIVIFAPGFSSKEEPQVQVITYVETAKVTDSASNGGTPGTVVPLGNPNIKVEEHKRVEPAPVPVQPVETPKKPEPTVTPEPIKKPEPAPVKLPDPPKVVETKEQDDTKVAPRIIKKPVKETAKTVVTTPQKDPSPRKPIDTPKKQITLGPVIHKDNKALQEAKDKANREAEERAVEAAATAARAQAVRGFENGMKGVLASLNKGLSSSTTVESPGVVGGGQASVNYREMVSSRYQIEFENSVTLAGRVFDNSNTVDVLVTISKSGKVTNSRITRASGNVPLDKVVGGVLRKVTQLPAFPESSSDSERVFKITFDLKTVQTTG